MTIENTELSNEESNDNRNIDYLTLKHKLETLEEQQKVLLEAVGEASGKLDAVSDAVLKLSHRVEEMVGKTAELLEVTLKVIGAAVDSKKEADREKDEADEPRRGVDYNGLPNLYARINSDSPSSDWPNVPTREGFDSSVWKFRAVQAAGDDYNQKRHTVLEATPAKNSHFYSRRKMTSDEVQGLLDAEYVYAYNIMHYQGCGGAGMPSYPKAKGMWVPVQLNDPIPGLTPHWYPYLDECIIQFDRERREHRDETPRSEFELFRCRAKILDFDMIHLQKGGHVETIPIGEFEDMESLGRLDA